MARASRDLDPDILYADAVRYHNVYGVYGISVFAVRDTTVDELAQQAPLIRFDRLSLLKVSDVVAVGGDLMDARIDLAADLNDEDDEGLGWSTLSEARDPDRIRPGAMLVAGNRQARAVVRVVAVDDDGQVHFTVLPGSVDKNRHLIGRALA